MKVLLDTHALLWAAISPHSLSQAAREIISDDRSLIVVSAASAWEIATKIRLGKLPGAEAFEKRFLDAVREAGYTLLPISIEDALRAGRLVGNHGDPFDRMIAAQAIGQDIPIISSDAKLDLFGVQRVW